MSFDLTLKVIEDLGTLIGLIGVPLMLYGLSENNARKKEQEDQRETLIRLDERVSLKNTTMDTVQKQQAADGTRLAALEVAVAQNREFQKTQDERYTVISNKLDIVAEIKGVLGHLAETCKTIVPRVEHEQYWRLTDQRFANLEREQDRKNPK